MNILLYPIYRLGDWLIKRDMEKWAKTPYPLQPKPDNTVIATPLFTCMVATVKIPKILKRLKRSGS